METSWKSVALKDFSMDAEGSFRALFAPFNVVDRQGDLTLPGAFGEQSVVISAYGHGSWNSGVSALPVGKGKIHDGKAGGIVEGRFFLDTLAGQETYKTVKNLGDLQEWSYALPEIDYEMRTMDDGQNVRVLKKIRVNEVSPVLMGAGIGTHLMDIKSGAGAASYGTLIDRLEAVAGDAQEVVERLKGVADLRELDNRHPSAATMARSLKLLAELREIAGLLDGLAKKHDAATREHVRFLRLLGGI